MSNHWNDINNRLACKHNSVFLVWHTLSLPLPFFKASLTMLEQSVMSKKKRLNALKHTNQTQKRRLEELKIEYQRLKPEGSGGAQSADARILKREEDAMVVTTMVVFFLVWCSNAHVYTFCKQCVSFRNCGCWRTGWRRPSLSARRLRTSRLTMRKSKVTCRLVQHTHCFYTHVIGHVAGVTQPP